MPKLGNTVEECLLAAWRKQRGDTVTEGDVLAEIETDKTTFELTAPTDGVLLETFFEAGALIPVFTTVCVIGAAEEGVEQFRPQFSTSTMVRGVQPGLTPRTEASSTGPSTGAAPTLGVGLTGGVSDSSPRPPLSPRARRFSREHDLQPPRVAGSGPRGRVLESDLRDLLHASLGANPAGSQAALELPEQTGRVGSDDASGGGGGAPSGSRLSLFRETIARRLREGLGATAQFTLQSSANAGPLLTLRRQLKAAADTSDITINDLVVYCTIRALLEMPALNAEFVDGVLYAHAEVHMAFACDTPRGLVVPVVRESQDLSLRGLSRRMRELATKAVGGVIGVDELSGGTFTVSNLGSLGVESFTPVVNPPQVAILGVDSIELKAVRKPDGNIEFIDAIGLSLTVDHQVIDGAPAARFLRVVKEKIEKVETLCTI